VVPFIHDVAGVTNIKIMTITELLYTYSNISRRYKLSCVQAKPLKAYFESQYVTALLFENRIMQPKHDKNNNVSSSKYL
jgi:hypothetical protein